MFKVGDLVELVGSHTSVDGKVALSGSKGRIVSYNTLNWYMVDCCGIFVMADERSIKPAPPITAVRASSLNDNYTPPGTYTSGGSGVCGPTVSLIPDNWSPATGYSATIKGFDIKCECGTASVKGGKHSTWCPVKETDNA